MSSVWGRALVASSANVKRTRGDARSCHTTAGNNTRPRGAWSKRWRPWPSPERNCRTPKDKRTKHTPRPRRTRHGDTDTPDPGIRGARRHLLAGWKQTGRRVEIPHRQARDMADGAHQGRTRAGHSRSVPRRRTIDRPPSGLRTDLTVTAAPVRRRGEEKSRCAPDGGTAEIAGVTWERVDAEDGELRACPSVDRPATPRLLDTGRPAGCR